MTPSCFLQVNAASEPLPLVGNVAPDFEAEAVYDQEFIKVSANPLRLVLCKIMKAEVANL